MSRPRESNGWLSRILAILAAPAALVLFVLGLELVKGGAAGIMPALDFLHVKGALNTFGLGWIASCLVLSGSPVAAVAITLFGAGQLTDLESLGMIAGSRFGAAFVVLLVGILQFFRGRRPMQAVSTGVLCLLVTWTVMAPAVVASYMLLAAGWIEGVRLPIPSILIGLSDRIYGPTLAMLAKRLPGPVIFAAGIATIIGSLALFDRVLPELDPEHSRFRQIAFVVYRPVAMFLLGAGVTCLTLSVSVSLGLLVPLSTKGYVRRENILPYIMGANVSTFVDTLAAAVLVGEPRAIEIVLALMIGVGFFSLLVVLGLYGSYRDGLERGLQWITTNRWSFTMFLGAIMIVPVMLMLL